MITTLHTAKVSRSRRSCTLTATRLASMHHSGTARRPKRRTPVMQIQALATTTAADVSNFPSRSRKVRRITFGEGPECSAVRHADRNAAAAR